MVETRKTVTQDEDSEFEDLAYYSEENLLDQSYFELLAEPNELQSSSEQTLFEHLNEVAP